jgi:hypothetical protein
MADIKWSEKTLITDPAQLSAADFFLYVNSVELVNYRVNFETFLNYNQINTSKLYQPDGTNPFVYTDNGGALHIDGDIIQNGSPYKTELETVKIKNNYVYLRESSVGGLAPGEYSGVEVKLYDGALNGRLVLDSSGVARVGDVGDEQPIMVRAESGNLNAGGILYWSSGSESAQSSAKLTQVDGRIIANGVSGYADGTQGDEDIVCRLVNQYSDVGTATVIRMINSTSVVSSTGGDIVTERTDSQGVGTNKMLFRTSNTAANFVDAFEIENGNMCLLDNEINDISILRGRSTDGFLTFRFEQAGAFLNLYGGNTGASMAKFFEDGDAYIAGDLGIGTETPSAKLDVNGDAKTTNGIVSGCVFTQTSDQTVANTTTETTLIGTGVGSTTIPANTLTEGKQIRIRNSGYISTPSSGSTTTFRVKFGGTTLITSVATIPNDLTDSHVELDFCITVRSGNTVLGGGKTLINDQNSSLGCAMRGLVQGTPVSFNPAIDNQIEITYEWGTATTTRTVTVAQTSIELLN